MKKKLVLLLWLVISISISICTGDGKIKKEVSSFFKTSEGKEICQNFIRNDISYSDAVDKSVSAIVNNQNIYSDRANTKFYMDCNVIVGNYLCDEYKNQTGIDPNDMTLIFNEILTDTLHK